MDRESIRKELRCTIHPLNSLKTYKYTVICSNFNGKWILSKHKNRNTWETQGGHIEQGETPLEAAKRELFEESGIVDADVYPVCDYNGYNSKSNANGMVFLAIVRSLGELPESEMKEIALFQELPQELTYPLTSPVLYAEAGKLLAKKQKGRKQTDVNPFENSDSNKRYYTYDYFLKKTYGGKCAKIPLDAGFSCPNMDGKCGHGGCVYCSSRGSGDFAESATLSIAEQFELTRSKLSSKWSTERTIPYFQARTNTYAPLEKIKEKFEQALTCDGVVAMNVATRADCLPDDIVEYLAELGNRVDLTIELGLQTVHDDIAELINRGHTYEKFVEGYKKLRKANSKIRICVHIIFGLPNETDEMMLETAKVVGALRPDMVKIHLLHVIKGTVLAKWYESGEYTPLEREHYIELVANALQYFHKDTVIARLTGDGMADELLAPDWSRKKVAVINDIDKFLFENDMWQGKLFK